MDTYCMQEHDKEKTNACEKQKPTRAIIICMVVALAIER